MAGTSLDGVDLALVSFRPTFRLHAAKTFPFPEALRQKLKAICFRETVPLKTVAEHDVELGVFLGRTVATWLRELGISPETISAIGSHGQTVLHHPRGPLPFTLQIGDPNLIAEITGITVVADFRRRDVAAGGQGAPLTPLFHREIFWSIEEDRAVLNLGGIANLTLLPRSGEVVGFDTGPANTLLDRWCEQHLRQPFDRDGRWAASGKPLPALLEAMLRDPFFNQPPPKSCGPEDFSLDWLEAFLAGGERPEDVQATLVQLTVESVRGAFEQTEFWPKRIYLCGGGCRNRFLVSRLRERLNVEITTTKAAGIDPDFVEAAAFAYLAYRTLQGHPSNLPSVTGARREVILGAIYPA